MSVSRGTFFSRTTPSTIKTAARIGSAAFLLPEICTTPPSSRPPLTRILSTRPLPELHERREQREKRLRRREGADRGAQRSGGGAQSNLGARPARGGRVASASTDVG